MATDYTAADALTYIREEFNTGLTWIHDTLAMSYGLETIDGEEYLPGALNDVMACLYTLHRTITEESVAMGSHRRFEGRLSRPRAYSNGRPLYLMAFADSEEGGMIELSCLQHPGGFNGGQVADSDEGCVA